MTPVQAVVFDMDGVLVESEDIWREVREEFAAGIGKVWTAADQVSTMGCNTATWAGIMVNRLDLRTALGMDEDDVAHEIIARMQAKYAVHLPQREGAVEAVRIAAAHYRVALASASPRALGEHVLRATGLDQVLTVTLYGDEVEHGKPAPDVYLRVLERIGVRPEHAVGVEDSGNGIRSLHAAGMGIIAAPSPGYALSAEMLALAGARIQSLTEFSVDLVERAGAYRASHGMQRTPLL
jgi:mannitol-1-/sugar-/sorbitol-6-/2-deoxyglucose-6-phosphatase